MLYCSYLSYCLNVHSSQVWQLKLDVKSFTKYFETNLGNREVSDTIAKHLISRKETGH